jgi:hypothetical protein
MNTGASPRRRELVVPKGESREETAGFGLAVLYSPLSVVLLLYQLRVDTRSW